MALPILPFSHRIRHCGSCSQQALSTPRCGRLRLPQYGYVTLLPRLFGVDNIHMNRIMPIQVNGAGKPKLESDNVRSFWYHGVLTLTLTSITSVIPYYGSHLFHLPSCWQHVSTSLWYMSVSDSHALLQGCIFSYLGFRSFGSVDSPVYRVIRRGLVGRRHGMGRAYCPWSGVSKQRKQACPARSRKFRVSTLASEKAEIPMLTSSSTSCR